MNLPVTMTESDRAGPKCNDRDCPIARAVLRAARAFDATITEVSAGLVWITLIASGKAIYRSVVPNAAFDYIWRHDQGETAACVGFCLELFSAGW